MSNTAISPTVAALAAAGVGLAMGLALAPVQNEMNVSGALPTTAAVSPIAPPFGGKPLSWLALAAGATGAAAGPEPFAQVRLTAAGTFGDAGAVLIEASPDNATWTTLAGMTDAISPGAVLGGAPGLAVTPIAGGVVVSVTDPTANAFRYLRPIVQNGDGTTAISVIGALSASGAC